MINKDIFLQLDIQNCIKRIEDLLTSGIFSPENSRSVLFRAAFIDMLIELRSLMYKSERHAKRISFTDDVKVDAKVRDVTDLIKFVRDAVCHPDSDNHYLVTGTSKATFNVIFGKGVLLETPLERQKSDYDDDTCFLFGSHGIYLKRHIIRAFTEAKANLKPFIAQVGR